MPSQNVPTCQCGCGGAVGLWDKTDHTQGRIKGQPKRFLLGHHRINRVIAPDFWEKVEKRGPDDCWEWALGRTPAGYGRVTTTVDGEKYYMAHRLAYRVATGQHPGKALVCHTCDNPPCCNPAHLFLGTPQDNVSDMVRKQRHRTGRGEDRSYLTDAAVARIRELYPDSKMSQLASEYGVSLSTISRIISGQRRVLTEVIR